MENCLSLELLAARCAALDRAGTWGWDIGAFEHECPEPHGERTDLPTTNHAGIRFADPWDELLRAA